MEIKTYELPISKNYVGKWGIQEALREILQNAIDSDNDGYSMSIDYENDKLIISNTGADLKINSLVLGNSSKNSTDHIGQYGEGYKLALIVLLRLGYKVTIHTNSQTWKVNFKHSEVFDMEILCIDVHSDHDSYNKIEFVIEGITPELFESFKNKHIVVKEKVEEKPVNAKNTDWGRLLLDKEHKGKMYVEGLYVLRDDNFAYGYDFKSEYVELDRDRNAINIYDLRELTARVVSAQEEPKILMESLEKGHLDTRDLNDFLEEMTKEKCDKFTKVYFEEHNLDEETFIGTQKEVKMFASNNDKTHVANSVIAKIVHKGLGKLSEYKERQEKIKNSTDKENAHRCYSRSSFNCLLEWFASIKEKLTREEQLIGITRILKQRTAYFNEIKKEIFEELNLEDFLNEK